MAETVSTTRNNDALVRELLLEKFEPIAIVGIGLRFPGGNESPEEFAAFLRAGLAGTGPIPADRWDVEGLHSDERGERGKILPVGGGFISDIDAFDPQFFNISPKEADYIDPQHRLALECAWKALESANINPATLRDSNGGVYLGICQMDYAIEVERLPAADLDPYISTGTAYSVAPGRLSFFLGWRGPCIAVDTACSASLTALHLAVQGLRRRECSIALCGGVNAIVNPRNHIVYSQANMLSPDGRCKTFDDRADGYSRSEGCGMLVLKRLSDAKRDGDRVLALVRGTSVRQDGESGGLTVPNGTAQVELIREALANAMLEPGDIQYVEAHGTGTPLGDPIEMGSIDAVFSASHSKEAPIVVGSVKTNVGHMEAAAGVGGIVKTVLQLQEGVIYPHVNLETPSRRIPWDRYNVVVPTKPQSWKGSPRRAVVNSFGFAGTLATAVLEQAPPTTAPSTTASDDTSIFTLSARNQAGLLRQAEQYRRFIDENPGIPSADLCYTTNVGRSHLNARLAGAVSSLADVRALLDAHLSRSEGDGGAKSELRGGGIAFLFTGQGSQYAGMGRTLYERYPAFRRHLDACDQLFAPHLGRSIKELLLGQAPGSEQDIHQTLYTQPALFAVEYAVAQLWISWGVRPSVLLGHSIGEIVAATVAGLFTLSDAVKLVAARGRLMQSVSAPGGMVAVRANAEDVAPLLAGYEDVSFGAINGAQQCVISGGRASVATISEALAARGIDAKPLPVSHAFHSPLMAEVFDAFREALKDIRFHEPTLSFVSNLTGKVAGLADVGTPEYWVRHIAEPVNFAAGLRCVQARGRQIFIEVGPAPTLIGIGRRSGDASAHTWVPSLDSSDAKGDTIRRALAQVYMSGIDVSWDGYHQDRRGRRIALPTYAFERKSYWLPLKGRPAGLPTAAAATPRHHELLGVDVASAARGPGEREFRTYLSSASPAYLADHIVTDQVVFPGAGFVEILLALEDAVFGETSRPLRDVRIHEALFLTDTPTEVRTRLRPAGEGQWSVEIVSRIAGRTGAIERRHVSATLGAAPGGESSLGRIADRLRKLADERGAPESVLSSDEVYAQFREAGLPYGPEFRRVRRVARHADGFAIGDLLGIDTPVGEYVRASILDCAMQTLVGVVSLDDAYLPVGFNAVELLKKPKGDLRALMQVVETSATHLAVDMAVLEGDRPVLIVDGLQLKRVATAAAGRSLFHEPRWLKRSLIAAKPAAPRARDVLIVHGGDAEFGEAARLLTDAGMRPHPCADSGEALRALAEMPDIRDVCWWWRPLPHLDGEARIRAECEENYRDLLALVGGMESLGSRRGLRVFIVTEGAQWLPGDAAEGRAASSLAASSVWGFGHVLLKEYPAFRVTLLDLPPRRQRVDCQPLADEIAADETGGGEFQVAYRCGVRHVKRLAPTAPAPAQDGNFELAITDHGQFSNIKQAPAEDVAPVGDEITVRVHAAGLNFKDVLNALGMLRRHALDAGLDYKPVPLGYEASGVVVAAGPDAGFKPGDAVILSHIGCMKKRVTVPSAAAVRKPADIGFAEAATLSTAYVTAYYALHDLAHIGPGDRVLIHAAAGGVGQAAVQLAKVAGAEVYATASPRKWPLLRSQGVRHIMNSRTLDFADEILKATDGRGVDVVLNSLSNDHIPASLRCLGRGGRFVELGKLGIWSPEQMREQRPDAAYHNFDLGEFPEAEFRRISNQILETVVRLIATGDLGPLPTVAYALDEVEEAFGVLSRGANAGKLALSFVDGRDEPDRPLAIGAHETYLVTGGLGALGMVTARKLVREGARHIALLSRRRVAQSTLDELRAEFGKDVELILLEGDVADARDVSRIMAELRQRHPPLAGIFHAAGVLADAPAAKQTWESIDKVFGPKVYGTWHLHQLAASLPSLRFFVAYSSISPVIGLAGQSNYAAANAFMDVLMHWRADRKLPGLSINWGPWAEVGLAANLTEHQIRGIEQSGVKFIKPAVGARALFTALTRPQAQCVVGEFEWERLVSAQPALAALLERIVTKRCGAAQNLDLETLLSQTKVERDAAVRSVLRAKVAELLHFDSPDHVEPDARFAELGLDSLAAVGLKNALETAFRIPLPTSTLFDYPAIQPLAEFISGQLVPDSVESPQQTFEVDVRTLTETEADAELQALREYMN
jgi:myxalamid-type polyketide synthase MxaB